MDLLFIALYTSYLHLDARRCTELHRVPPSWLYFFYINFWIAPSTTKFTVLLWDLQIQSGNQIYTFSWIMTPNLFHSELTWLKKAVTFSFAIWFSELVNCIERTSLSLINYVATNTEMQRFGNTFLFLLTIPKVYLHCVPYYCIPHFKSCFTELYPRK